MSAQYGGLTPAEWQLVAEQPALAPPPGQTSHFHGHSTLFPWVMVIMGLQLGTALVVLPIRIFTFWRVHRRFSLEDFFAVLAFLIQIGEDIDVTYGNAHSYSQHMWNVTFGDFLAGLKYIYVVNITYGAVILCLKLAILLQFLRLFAPKRQNNPYMWYGSWILIVCNAIFYIVIIGAAAGVCTPVEKFWNPAMHGHCLNLPAAYKSTGVINSVSDFIILLLPLPTLYRLKLPTKTKLGVMSIFGVGVFAVAVSIIRTYYIWFTFGPTADMTWNITVVGICFWAEFTMGILAFSLPMFPQFVRIVKAWVRRSPFGGRNGSDSAPESGSDVEMNVQREKVTAAKPHYIDVSLASFEVREPSNYGSHFDPHQAVHAITHG